MFARSVYVSTFFNYMNQQLSIPMRMLKEGFLTPLLLRCFSVSLCIVNLILAVHKCFFLLVHILFDLNSYLKV